MDEKKREEIKKEAKEILAKFSKAIGKVKLGKEKGLKEEVGGFREEATTFEKGSRSPKESKGCDLEFREKMFDNAPDTDEDCIVAEKKKW